MVAPTQEPVPLPTEPGSALATVPERTPLVVETASVAVAAQAKASVEARYLVAMKNPRSWDTVRLRILQACKRLGFAEGARYSKPVGGKSIVGPSIRFAEESLRAMGNAYVETMVVFDDEERRIVRVTVTDLESNLSYPHDITVEKTVERQKVREGQEVIGRRQNTKGVTVYLIRATEDDLLVKQAAMVSKAIRTGALRLLPSDILEEAMELVPETLLKEDAKDPASARKRVCDAFFSIGVEPTDLEEYLGHKLEGSTPAEISLLRTIYQALRDGETTWPEVLETKGKNGGFKKADRGTDALREKISATPAATEPPSPAAEPKPSKKGKGGELPFGGQADD
jgi:hypothetical protein